MHPLRKLPSSMIGLALILPSGCATAAPRAELASPGPPKVASASSLAVPAAGAVVEQTIHQGERMVTRLMRLGPGSAIPEHHHPHFEETFSVQRGALTLMLNDRPANLRAGDVVYIPAGTIISGTNRSSEEAVVLVVWARMEDGPLTVPGRGHSAH